jgi:predicted esterase
MNHGTKEQDRNLVGRICVHLCSSVVSVAVAGFVVLLLAGAMLWAKGRDPFQRVWFTVRGSTGGKAECVAVLPKPAARPLPVVVYLHGAGGNVLGSGNDLRQMAEVGLAVVSMDYCQTNEAAFAAQFTALLGHLQRQRWADTNRMAWVGYSLGAQRLLSHVLQHPERRPELLVRLAGGWVSELESKVLSLKSKVQDRESGARHSPALPLSLAPQSAASVLLVHGELDEVFPLAQAREVAACLQTNGVPVELRVLPGQAHGFGVNRLLVFRAVGEQCLERLGGPGALAHYRSILSWQAAAKPLWVFWTPALVWALGWVWWWGRVGQASRLPPEEPRPAEDIAVREEPGASVGRRSADLESAVPQISNVPGRQVKGESAGTEQLAECNSAIQPIPNLRYGRARAGGTPTLLWWEIGLRWLAAALAVAALAQTALLLVPPRLGVSNRTLAIARAHLVAPKERADFEFLAAQPVWRGKRLKTMLEHVELANYTRQLINWKLEEQVYRDYVLSPEIEPAADGGLNWRRLLWENFYPRIRREGDPQAAAEIVVRFLRERVSLAAGDNLPTAVADIWRRQIASERVFEALYVAAMRSVGIPSRLGAEGRAQLWNGSAWQAAPRPLVERWE